LYRAHGWKNNHSKERRVKFYALAIGHLNPDAESSAIQWGLSRKYGVPVNWSHCALLVEGGTEALARFNGVWDLTARGWDQCTVEELFDGAVARHKIKLNIIDDELACGWLLGYRKTPYSILQFFTSVPDWMRSLAKMLLPEFILKKFANGKAAGYCSEGIARFIVDNCPTASGDLRLSDSECDRCDPFKLIPIALDYGVSCEI
jgi:hypothetical protein